MWVYIHYAFINKLSFLNRVLDLIQTTLTLRENQGSGSRLLPLMFPISSGYRAVHASVHDKIFGFGLPCVSRVKEDFAVKMLCNTVGIVICSISHLVFVHVLTMCIKCATIVSFSD